MQYYADFKENGDIAGFYVDEIHGSAIPALAIPITVEQWELYISDASKYRLDNGNIREKTQQELDDESSNQPPVEPSIESRLQAAEEALTALLGI